MNQAPALSQEEAAQARSSGWGLFRGFLSPAETFRLKAAVTDLVNHPERHGTAIYFYSAGAGQDRLLTRVDRVWEELPLLHETGVARRLMTVAQAYLETDVVLFKDKVNVRRPGGQGYPPHQDSAGGWEKYSTRFITMGVVLSRSDPAHGGFEVVPDAHRLGRLPHTGGGMSEDDFNRLKPKPVEADSGDLLLMDGETPHRSVTNASDVNVLHLLFTFAPASAGRARDVYYERMAANIVPLSADGRYTTRVADEVAKQT